MARYKIPKPVDDQKFVTFYGLDLNEIILFGALTIITPLLVMATGLPFQLKLLAVACLWGTAFMLLFHRVDERSMLFWIGKLLPYWLSQRTFRATVVGERIGPLFDLVDRVSYAPLSNHISYIWQSADDGAYELHIYENPAIAQLLHAKRGVPHSRLPTKGRPDEVR